LTTGAAALLVLTSMTGVLSSSILIAAAPGLVTAGTIAMWPPLPARLRRVGWTLVAVSVITAALVLSTK
jgi:hypothetical protein